MTRQNDGVWKLNDDDMNFLSIALSEAAERLGSMGAEAISRTMRNMSTDIYVELEDNGYYRPIQTA